MNKVSLIGRSKYLGIAIIMMQGLLLTLLMIFFINQQYRTEWIHYPNKGHTKTIYIKDSPVNKQLAIQNYLLHAADDQQLFIVRRDSRLDNDGHFIGFKLGVYGDISGNDISLTFLNKHVLHKGNLGLLLNSNEKNVTLGMETGSFNRLGTIPHFRFCEQVIVTPLAQVFRDSDTVNGTYFIMGLHTKEKERRFIAGLSQVSTLSTAQLVTQMSGEYLYDNFRRDILLVFIIAQLFLNVVFFLVLAVTHLRKQGNLVLLGWSRSAFSWKLLGTFIVFSVVIIPFVVGIGWFLSGWEEASSLLLSYFVLTSIVNVILVVIEVCIAAVVIMLTKPLDAIHARIPKKPLYILGIVAYLLVSSATVFCGCYVDGPAKHLSENVKLARYWNDVAGYQLPHRTFVGDDVASFSGKSNQFDQDIYNWYSSIAGKDGVYIVHTEYYDERILQVWKENGVYKNIPANPFWYFTLSPNYLAKLGISIDHDALIEAQQGVRLYLVPDTLSDNERKQMITHFKEDSATKNIRPSDIQTQFTKKQQFKFVTYHAEKPLFTWATDSNQAMSTSAPMIYVSTPENMRYFENESLRVTGLNSYIRFENEAVMKQYTQEHILNQFHLSDNGMIFTSVQQYIDGIQKNIWLTISWFGGAFLILVIILIGLLLTLATLFRIVNQEKINVKKFLGFSFWQLYRNPILLLSCVIGLELIVTLFVRSTFGFLGVLFVALLQLFIFERYMVRNELKRMLLAFKGE